MNQTKLLNETKIGNSLTSRFPNLYPSAMFQLMRFSPTYNPDHEECKMTIPIEKDKMQIVTSTAEQFDGIECSQNATGSSTGLQFTYKCPGIMKAQGMLYPHLKQLFLGNVPKTLKFHDGMLDIVVPSKSTFELCNIFKLCKTLETTRNLKSFQPYSKEDVLSMPQDVKNEIATHVQKIQIPGQSSVLVEGKYGDIAKFIETLRSYDAEINVDEAGIDVVNLSKIYEDAPSMKIFDIANNMIKSSSSLDDLLKVFRSKGISKMLRTVIRNNQDYKIDQLKQKKAQQNGEDFISAGLKFIDLNAIKTIDDLFNVTHAIINSSTGLPDPDSIQNKTARRRLKLFADAKFYGAQLHYNNEWICAVCPTVASASIWSRNKPRVYADGPNKDKIIQYANLRDDELEKLTIPSQLKPLYKKIRDSYDTSGTEKYVDGNGNTITLNWKVVSDNLGHDDRSRECYWCTAGAFRDWYAWEKHTSPVANWFDYNKTPKSKPNDISNRRPNWVFMRISDGSLYQYTNGWYDTKYVKKLLDEVDRSQGYGGAEAMASGFISKYPAFADLVKKLDVVDSSSTIDDTNSETISDEFSLEFADDGSIIISQPKYINAYLVSASNENVDSFTIRLENADNLFENKDLTNISRINFDGVRSAVNTFKNARLARKLVVVGTSQIANALGMFQNAKGMQSLEGLNLRRCKTARQCFCGMIGYHNQPFTIQNQLSLPRCEDVSYMFFASPIVKIDLADTNNVRLAESMCQYATYLEEVPDLRFEKVPTYNQLISQHGSQTYGQVQDDPTIFFAGCSTLYRNFDLEDEGERLIQYYDWKHNSSQPEYRSDGFIVIKSRSDLETFRKFLPKAPGIAVDVANAQQLFKDFPLNCGVLDLKQVTNADKMFENCNILHIRNIVNSDNIISAKEMFSGCKAGFLPEISLQKAVWINGIFKNSQIMHFPKLKLGMNVKTDMSDLTSIFGNALKADDDIVLRQSLARIESWYDDAIKRQPEIAYLKSKTIELEEGNPNAGYALVIDDEQIKTFINSKLIEWQIEVFEKLNIKKIIVDLEDASQLFSSKSTRYVHITLPPIDLRNVVNAEYMFSYIVFDTLVVIENANKVQNCSHMFETSRFNAGLKICPFPQAKMCERTFTNVRVFNEYPDVDMATHFPIAEKCNSMFMYSIGVLKDTVNLANSLQHVNDGENMFCNVKGKRNADVVFQGNIKIPFIENGNSMFRSCTLSEVKEIILPYITKCNRMFLYASFNISPLSNVDLPVAEEIGECFASSNVETIGCINAPNARRANQLFSRCNDLKNIGMFIIGTNNPNERSTTNMFEYTKLVASCGKHGHKILAFFDLINS